MNNSSTQSRFRLGIALALVVMGCQLASTPSMFRSAPEPRFLAPAACATMASARQDSRCSGGAGHSETQLEARARSDDAAVPRDLDTSDALGLGVSPVRPLASVEVTTERVEPDGERHRPSGAIAAAAADEELETWNIGGRTDGKHVSNRAGYHPGTRVRVDARPRLGAKFLRSRGGIALGQRVVAALRNHGYWPFRNCFEDVARVHPDPGGKTALQLTVDGGGNVRHSRLLRTDLKERSIALCVVAAARRLHLDPNHLRRLDVDVTVALWPGDVPLLPLPTRTNANCPDLAPASQSVRSIEPEVVRCMQVAREKDPKIWGRLALAFTIDDGGHPVNLSEQYSTFGDADALRCVVDRLQTLAFAQRSPPCSRLVAAWRLHRPVPTERPSDEGVATDAAHTETEIARPKPESAGVDIQDASPANETVAAPPATTAR